MVAIIFIVVLHNWIRHLFVRHIDLDSGSGISWPTISLDSRENDDKLYILADKRSLGPPPLPLPRGIVAICTMLPCCDSHKARCVLIASHLRASLAGTATRPSSVGISGHPAPARLSYRESIYRPATEGPRTDSKRAAPIPAGLLVYMHMMGVCQILWCSKQMTRKVYKTAFNVPSLHHLHVERLPT